MADIAIEPQYCEVCGLIVWYTWPDYIPCDDEEHEIEHECNP